MKKLFIIVQLILAALLAHSQAPGLYLSELDTSITSSGGTVTLPQYGMPDIIYLYSGAVTLSNNYSLTYSGVPPAGKHIIVFTALNVSLNGHTISLFGKTLTTKEAGSGSTFNGVFDCYVVNVGNPTFQVTYRPAVLDTLQNNLEGTTMILGRIPFNALTNFKVGGDLLVGNSLGVPTDVTVSGDVTMSNAGVITIDTGAVSRQKIAGNAGILWSQLATGTASQVAVTSSGGALTTAAQVTATQGGTGINTNVSTGFATVSSGTWSVGALTEDRTYTISFESGYQCDNKIKFDFPGTITGAYAYVVKAIAGTDSAFVTLKNNAGTTMSNGAFGFPASTAQGTAVTVAPSANNTFIAGDIIYATTSKATAGGVVLLTLKYTRTQ